MSPSSLLGQLFTMEQLINWLSLHRPGRRGNKNEEVEGRKVQFLVSVQIKNEP